MLFKEHCETQSVTVFSDIMDQTNKRGKELDNFPRDMVYSLNIKAKWKQVEILKEYNIPSPTVNDAIMKFREYSWKT
jgi:hypothetical protein